MLVSSSIMVGDDGGVSMVRSTLVEEGSLVEVVVGLVIGEDLVFLGRLREKVTFFLEMEGAMVNC